MAAEHPQRSRRFGDVSTELKGLSLCLIPVSDDAYPRFIEKLIALLLVLTWSGITVLLTLDMIATGTPPFWLPFTALVFLLVGRLWDIEVSGLLPVATASGDDPQDPQTPGRDTEPMASKDKNDD